MHSYRVSYKHDAGALNEVVKSLRSRIQSYIDSGRHLFMMSQVAGPDDGGFKHQLISFIENIEGFGEGTAGMYVGGVDKVTADWLSDLELSLNSPVQYELWEVIEPFSADRRPAKGDFILRESWRPLPDRASDFFESAVRRLNQRRSEGAEMALYWLDLTSDSPVAQMMVRYEGLGEMETERVRLREDAVHQEWLKEINPMVRGNHTVELWTIVTDPPTS